MTPRLDLLPQELLNNILVSLSVRDSFNLRSVCRALRWRVMSASCRDKFRRKQLEINQQNLEHFVAVTQAGGLGCLVEDLTVCGVVINYDGLLKMVMTGTKTHKQLSGFITLTCEDPLTPMERYNAHADLAMVTKLHTSYCEMVKSGEAVALLTQAFQNIKTYSPTQQLPRLTLEIYCIMDSPYRRYSPSIFGHLLRYTPIWPVAAETFQITMSALTESKLRVQDLTVYNNPDLDACSLFQSQLKILDFPELKTLTSCLRILSLSLLHPIPVYIPYAINNNPKVENDFIGLEALVAHCTVLEVLDIHFCYSSHNEDLQNGKKYGSKLSGAPYSSKSIEQVPRRLQLLVLDGLRVRERNLLAFLEHNKSMRLELRNLKLTEGSFRPIFDFCSSPLYGLTSLRFKDLSEGECIYFTPFDATNHEVHPRLEKNSLSRDGNDIWLPIHYNTPSPYLTGRTRDLSINRFHKAKRITPLPGRTADRP